MRDFSPLHKERLNYKPKLAGILSKGINNVKVSLGENTNGVKDKEEKKELFSDVYGQPIG